MDRDRRQLAAVAGAARLPELASLRGALFMLGFAAIIAALTVALLALFAWRGRIKPAAGVFLLSAAAAGAHFMGTYGVVLDPSDDDERAADRSARGRRPAEPAALRNLLLLAVLPLAWLARLRCDAAAGPAQAWRNGAGDPRLRRC